MIEATHRRRHGGGGSAERATTKVLGTEAAQLLLDMSI